ncbi:MAG TPA: PqqD family protein [Bacilli bacterium]|nr:MAG: Coenzyme PQQ synthesis protein D (PqqD) [Tenericutes bacterium ADurb.BinA124]HNZ50739.1 PqqD family protein [Bacilli bacterium]HOH18662.1 PqqD family protein [Bacilli bacterium]HPX84495.1 PqqD family protein [Bacilli bacterium]HQC74621.1 PqqD family protein [Bacilli bacterium]
MKVKQGFMLREIANNYVVVPVGKAAIDFNGIITLNQTGAFLWEQLQEEISLASLQQKLMAEYEVDEKTALADIKDFIDHLKTNNLLE